MKNNSIKMLLLCSVTMITANMLAPDFIDFEDTNRSKDTRMRTTKTDERLQRQKIHAPDVRATKTTKPNIRESQPDITMPQSHIHIDWEGEKPIQAAEPRSKPDNKSDTSKQTTPERKATKIEHEPTPEWTEPTAFEPVANLGGRSRFLDALKSKNLDEAKTLWDQTRQSPVLTEEFLDHIVKIYDNRVLMTELYPKKSYDETREQLENDLFEVSPHLAKVFRDLIRKKSGKELDLSTLQDPEYVQTLIDYYEKNPLAITQPYKAHEPTPLELAISTKNSYWASKIIEIARKNKISSTTLIEPLVNEYKKLLRNDDDKKTLEFVDSVLALKIKRISDRFLTEVDALTE